MPTTVQTSAAPQVTQTRPEFGKGPFSRIMESFYDETMKLLEWPSATAEKVARQFGSDLGAIHSKLQFDLAVGKPTKDMLRSLTMKAKSAKFALPPSVCIYTALQFIGEAFKAGIDYQKTDWHLIESLQEWVDNLVKP